LASIFQANPLVSVVYYLSYPRYSVAMDSLSSSIISCRELEYIIIDQNLIIIEVSSQPDRFSEFPEEIKIGNDIRLALPELCGLEEVIDLIGQQGCQNFNLKSLAKTNPRFPSVCYVDLYIGCIPPAIEGERNMIILMEDTTEQAIVQQKLFQRVNESSLLKSAWSDSQLYLNKLINSMADALLITDAQGIIKKINPAAEKMFGYEEQELLDRSISILIFQSNEPPFSNLNFEFPNVDQFLVSEIDCITKSGQDIVVSFSCSQLQTTLTEMPDLIYMGKNMTQRVQVETIIRQALNKEKEINDFKSNFVSAISHQLKPPIDSLLFASKILQEIKKKEQDKIVDSIQFNIISLIKLVEEFVWVSKIDNSNVSYLSKNCFNITEFCKNIISDIQSSLGNSQKLVFLGNENIEAFINTEILKYLIKGTIYGVIKKNSSNLEVYLKKTRGEILFEVFDPSRYVIQENQNRLVNENKILKISEIGLELAIVQQYVEIHGGRIELESDVKFGTVFRLVLPLQSCTIDDQ
jgi:PAS domain S-box-containing protein